MYNILLKRIIIGRLMVSMVAMSWDCFFLYMTSYILYIRLGPGYSISQGEINSAKMMMMSKSKFKTSFCENNAIWIYIYVSLITVSKRFVVSVCVQQLPWGWVTTWRHLGNQSIVLRLLYPYILHSRFIVGECCVSDGDSLSRKSVAYALSPSATSNYHPTSSISTSVKLYKHIIVWIE